MTKQTVKCILARELLLLPHAADSRCPNRQAIGRSVARSHQTCDMSTPESFTPNPTLDHDTVRHGGGGAAFGIDTSTYSQACSSVPRDRGGRVGRVREGKACPPSMTRGEKAQGSSVRCCTVPLGTIAGGKGGSPRVTEHQMPHPAATKNSTIIMPFKAARK